MIDVFDLERNDVEMAVEFYRESVLDGTWDPDDGSILLQLQDNSDELERRLAEVDQEPAVAAVLAHRRTSAT